MNVTAHCAKIDALVSAARAAGVLTIAVADGGNDLGCALVRDAVLRVVPGARTCACPRGGTVVPTVEPDLLVPGVIPNWAAYGIEAAMHCFSAVPRSRTHATSTHAHRSYARPPAPTTPDRHCLTSVPMRCPAISTAT